MENWIHWEIIRYEKWFKEKNVEILIKNENNEHEDNETICNYVIRY